MASKTVKAGRNKVKCQRYAVAHTREANRARRAKARARKLERAQRPARAARLLVREAKRHVRRHGLHVAGVLASAGLPAYGIAQAKRARCPLCESVVLE